MTLIASRLLKGPGQRPSIRPFLWQKTKTLLAETGIAPLSKLVFTAKRTKADRTFGAEQNMVA